MSKTAQTYIFSVVTTGIVILGLAAKNWSPASLPSFLAFLGFTLFASTLKVRIPGMTGTMSPNFVFLLIGMTLFSFPEVVAAAFAAAILQSVWRPKRKLQLVQVAFSAATLVVSSALAFFGSHFVVARLGMDSPVPLLFLAGSIYLSLNTALVSIVVSLVEQYPLEQILRRCCEACFPYFAFGILAASLLGGSVSTARPWQTMAVVAPAAVLAYLYFLGRLKPMTQVTPRAVEQEEEELVGAGSYHR